MWCKNGVNKESVLINAENTVLARLMPYVQD